MTDNKLSHLDSEGRAVMVDIGEKPVTSRRAVAEGFLSLARSTVDAITAGTVPKGEVLAVARVAGILAAKRCGELIPLCHPLPIESIRVDFQLPQPSAVSCRIRITAVATITAKTGIEMEVLTAVSVAALTIYDMCKAIDKQMSIDGIRLLEKTGGKTFPVVNGPRPHSIGEE